MPPEERVRQRERIAIAATPAPAIGSRSEVSWPAVWAGLCVAAAALALLTALGVAVGTSVLAATPATAGDAAPWTMRGGLWDLLAAMLALFLGGLVSTGVGLHLGRPAAAVSGTAVWALAALGLVLAGVAWLVVGPTVSSLRGGIRGGGPAMLEAAPNLAAAFRSGNVDRVISVLGDQATVDRIASATTLPRDRVAATLTGIRTLVEAERGNPGQAIANARSGVQDLLASAAQPAPAGPAVAERQVGAWTALIVLVATLAAAVLGAAIGRRATAGD